MSEERMTVAIDPGLVERFPGLLVGGFAVGGLDGVAGTLPDDPFRGVGEELAGSEITLQNLIEDRRIAGWRQAIGGCGIKPSRYKSSPEQLARRVLKGGTISTPIPLVNLYCAVSTRHLAAMGGYDVALLPAAAGGGPAPIELRTPRPGDRFQPLGGKAEEMPLEPEVAIYAAGSEVLCWAFNHRDSRATAIRPETRRALFLSEGVEPEQAAATRAALAELAERLAAAGASPGPLHFADAAAPSFELAL